MELHQTIDRIAQIHAHLAETDLYQAGRRAAPRVASWAKATVTNTIRRAALHIRRNVRLVSKHGALLLVLGHAKPGDRITIDIEPADAGKESSS